jgi:hypothetical protein
MNSRKFTVFIDDVSTARPQQAPKPPSNNAAEEDAGISSLSATEKENLHPLTGGRLRSSGTVGLKRKSSVLATKLHNPPDTKGTKHAPTLAPSKKRKAASSSNGQKEQSQQRTRRVKLATRQRPPPELASIAEEKDERLARRLSRSDVDPRCYDSTVNLLTSVPGAFAHPALSFSKDSKAEAATKRKKVGHIPLTIYPRWPHLITLL